MFEHHAYVTLTIWTVAVEEGWGTTEIFEVECKHLEELTTVAQAVGARFNMKIWIAQEDLKIILKMEHEEPGYG